MPVENPYAYSLRCFVTDVLVAITRVDYIASTTRRGNFENVALISPVILFFILFLKQLY